MWAGYRDEKVREELTRINQNNVRPLRIDVTDSHSIEEAKLSIEKSGIPLNVVFNNAGIALGGPIEILDIDEVKKVYDVNFFGYLRLIKAFLPLLRQSSGRIVNMSSLAGLVGVPFLMPYSSSKFAIEGMSDGLRRELAQQSIQVVVIEPGPIKTVIWEKSLKQSGYALKNNPILLTPYQPAVDNFTSLLERNHIFSVSLVKLEKAIIKSVECRKPRIRYLVYKNSILLKCLIWVIPNRILDFLFKQVLTRRYKIKE